MTSPEHRWNELQSRWARGDTLSAQEEQERLAYAEYDALARKELEVFAALRARAAAPDEPVAQVLIGRALEALKGSPRLRLVTASSSEAPEVQAPRRLRPQHSRVARIAVGGLLLAAASAAALFAARLLPAGSAPVSEARAPLAPSHARAELVLSAGQVEVTGRSFRVGQSPLNEGESVTTGEGRACLTIDPGIDVCLTANTAIQLESLAAGSVRLRLARGTALATLSRRAPGSSFSLVSADVSALAHGTTYAVRREGDLTHVIVVEGTVEVARGRDQRELVDAHSRLVVPSRPGAFAKTAVGRSEEARLLALGAPRRLWSGVSLGVLELAAAGAGGGGLASIDDDEPLPLPLQTFASAGTHRIRWRDGAGVESTAWTEISAGQTRRLTAPIVGSAGAGTAVPAERPTATSLLEQARRELAHGRTRQALALYEQLRARYPASAEARTVLVTMGKLELDLGRSERALRRFDAYLRDGGTLVPEALAGKARALRALGREQEERRAIQQYLAAHAEGFEAPLFAKRLRELSGP
jgi:ferric-dicitrate binding protein FerR (iron transport regulator)